MSISTIGNIVTIKSINYSKNIPTRVNIKKRFEEVVYKTLSNNNNINLSYVIGTKITPSNTLIISDKSYALTNNRNLSAEQVIKDVVQNINLTTTQFVVTDVFTDETPSAPATPLFYYHKLKQFNSDLSDFSFRTLLSYEFVNENLQTIANNENKIDITTGKLYNNIVNHYISDYSFSYTYIKYTVKLVSGGVTTINVYHELINNISTFQQATFDDVDEFGTLDPTKKVYLLDEIITGEYYLITLPLLTTYAWKTIIVSKIKILPSTAVDNESPWYVRISNGNFISALPATLSSVINYKYYIPEFFNQSFTPYPPYKYQLLQKATWLSKKVIYVPRNIVNDPDNDFYIDIYVYDEEDTLLYAFSNDINKIGTTYSGNIAYTNTILSVDEAHGFIELSQELLPEYKIKVSYFIEEDEYEFTAINFNPITNNQVQNLRIVLYLCPETYLTGVLDSTLFYLIVDSLGRIIYSSQAEKDAGSINPATIKLLNEDFYSNGLPKYDIYYNEPSTASGLLSRVGGFYDEFKSELSFQDKYTVQSVLLSPSITLTGTMVDNYEENSRFLILGDISVGEIQNPDSMSIIDVRNHGGGLKTDKVEESFKLQPEATWYWDLDKAFPSVNAFLVEVPQTLLTTHGGNFTTEQLRDIIERHVDIGAYPIIRTYGIDPVITSGLATSSGITLYWPSYGDSITYQVYNSFNLNDGFANSGEWILSDNSLGNSFIVSGLLSKTKYYLKIGAYDSNNDESFSPTVAFTTN